MHAKDHFCHAKLGKERNNFGVVDVLIGIQSQDYLVTIHYPVLQERTEISPNYFRVFKVGRNCLVKVMLVLLQNQLVTIGAIAWLVSSERKSELEVVFATVCHPSEVAESCGIVAGAHHPVSCVIVAQDHNSSKLVWAGI